MATGRTRFRSFVSHEDVNPHARVGSLSPYAGLPVGAELHGNWLEWYQPYISLADIPTLVNGWTINEVGASATQLLSQNAHPPHLVLLNQAGDNNAQNLLFDNVGGAAGTGTFFDLTGGAAHYFEFVFRVSDANDNDNTVELVDWFVGFAVTGSNPVLDGTTDYVGFVKYENGVDATNSIDFVMADAGTGILNANDLVQPTGWTTLNPSLVTPDTQAGHRAAKVMGPNEWIRLAAYLEPSSDGTTGSAYIFVNNVHEATVDMAGEIPDINLGLQYAVRNAEATTKSLEICHARILMDLRML